MKALRSGADEVAEMVKLLAKMFRAALSEQTQSHKIRDEIEYAQAYIRLQNLRFRDMFFLQVEVEEQVQDSRVISMILQPVIENSIEHGFKGRRVPLHIVLTGRLKENGTIMLQICDDGKGISSEKTKEVNRRLEENVCRQPELVEEQEEGRTSIGLRNIAERIKLQYGDAYYLRLFAREEGAGVEICIPWRETR